MTLQLTLLQVIAKGLLLGKHAYLKSGWNIMDGFLVFISLIDIAFVMLSSTQSPRIFGILRVFRLLRTLRPLRHVYFLFAFKIIIIVVVVVASSSSKHAKYTDLPEMCTFPQPLAFETHGVTHSSALDFLNAVGGRLAAASGDPRETSFLRQRVSVLIQRFNAIVISKTFLHPDEAPDL